MGNLFNMDNAFFSTISKIVDIVVISLIWFIVCIPIFTIGPATSALYYVIVKVIRRERGYLIREFFSAFKNNFKVGSLATIIVVLAYLILFFDRRWALTLEGVPAYIFLSVFNAMIFIFSCVVIYMFPILSRFKLSLKQLFKNALFMSLKHLPSTILIAIILAVFALATYIIIPFIFLAPGVCCLLISFLFERIFKKYMPEKDENADESGRDEWYLE